MTGRRSAAGQSRGESGSTLIEVLVAVVIMGIAFVVIVGGIGTAIIGSDLQKQKAGADVALRTAAEKLPYLGCPGTVADYQGQVAPVTGFNLTVTAVSYWDGGANKFMPPGPSCSDTGLQLIVLSAVATSGRQPSPETLRVVKRRP